jgi:quinol monooxygenase YgiN
VARYARAIAPCHSFAPEGRCSRSGAAEAYYGVAAAGASVIQFTHVDDELKRMINVLTVVARIRATSGNGDALAALLSEQAAAVRTAEPGCLVYRVHRSTTDPELFLFYETYADDAALDVHRKAPHLAAFRQRRDREGLTAGPPEVEVFRSFTE